MRVMITGASGFVGSALTARLIAQPRSLGQSLTRLLLADLAPSVHDGGQISEPLAGDIADPAFVDRLVEQTPDVLFHLASVPGGAAEKDPQTGAAVNLHASIRLFERMRNSGKPPVVVFASTVAVYGAPLPDNIDSDTPLRPITSYGTHKLITEYLLTDLSRRGELDARCVRLPGIVARPQQANGHVSAFMSNIFHAMRAGEPFVSPVSAKATCWWMSVSRCVDNLLHAARLEAIPPGNARVWPLPILRYSVGDLVTALGNTYGADRPGLVTYAPDAAVEAAFGRYPPLDDSLARSLGFRDDESIEQLIRNALTS